MHNKERCIECPVSLLCETGVSLMVGVCAECGDVLRVNVHVSPARAISGHFTWMPCRLADFPFEVTDSIKFCTEALDAGKHKLYMVLLSSCDACMNGPMVGVYHAPLLEE